MIAKALLGVERRAKVLPKMLAKILAKTLTRAVLCAAFVLGLLSSIGAASAAEDCPGHPDALGTSRTLVVDPRQHPRIGTMQYARNAAAQGP